MPKNIYIHIGSEIYEFQAPEKIDKYFSLVGNNDVPYPIALSKNYVYFMLEGDHNYVNRNRFSPKTNWYDAYAIYYGYIPDANGDKGKQMKGTKMKKFKMIRRCHR